MKATQILALALAAPLALAQDAPCTNEACTSLCNATPSCLSTLFDPATGLCYTFSCVLETYSRPSKFLGYLKPGASYECPADQPVPGEPTSPPPDLVVSSEAAPPGGGETSTRGASPSTTDAQGSTAATPTSEPSSGATGGTSDDKPGSPGDATDGTDEDPAAPTIELPAAAGQLGIPGSMVLAPLALLLL
ncbi:hypothetical protein IMZ48_11980 [Candidatus Bathyarchaeota archaeon]|nr:hypothetical protein [Candidatus Bathyarchaeota archaeon]